MTGFSKTNRWKWTRRYKASIWHCQTVPVGNWWRCVSIFGCNGCRCRCALCRSTTSIPRIQLLLCFFVLVFNPHTPKHILYTCHRFQRLSLLWCWHGKWQWRHFQKPPLWKQFSDLFIFSDKKFCVVWKRSGKAHKKFSFVWLKTLLS